MFFKCCQHYIIITLYHDIIISLYHDIIISLSLNFFMECPYLKLCNIALYR